MNLQKLKEELESKSKLTKAERSQLQDCKEQIPILEKFMSDAAAQRQAVKDCVGVMIVF